MPCNCGKTREQRMQELARAREARAFRRQERAGKPDQRGPLAPGYVTKQN